MFKKKFFDSKKKKEKKCIIHCLMCLMFDALCLMTDSSKGTFIQQMIVVIVLIKVLSDISLVGYYNVRYLHK